MKRNPSAKLQRNFAVVLGLLLAFNLVPSWAGELPPWALLQQGDANLKVLVQRGSNTEVFAGSRNC